MQVQSIQTEDCKLELNVETHPIVIGLREEISVLQRELVNQRKELGECEEEKRLTKKREEQLQDTLKVATSSLQTVTQREQDIGELLAKERAQIALLQAQIAHGEAVVSELRQSARADEEERHKLQVC